MIRVKFHAEIKATAEIKTVYGITKDHVFLESLDSPEFFKNVYPLKDVVLMMEYEDCGYDEVGIV